MAMVQTETCSKAFGGTVEPLGFDFQVVNSPTPYIVLRLHAQKKMISENGALMKKTRAITSEMAFGNGEEQSMGGKLMSALKRAVAGEKFLTQHFKNTANVEQDLVIAAPHPGQIIAVDLHQCDQEIICQRSAFLAGPAGTEIVPHVKLKIGFNLFGREEFVMQKIKGDDVVFLNVGGGIYADDLAEGEEIQIDTGCLVACTKDVKIDLARSGKISSMLLGDDGAVLVNCTGPGRVWMQPMPFARQVAVISQEQARQGKPSVFSAEKR